MLREEKSDRLINAANRIEVIKPFILFHQKRGLQRNVGYRFLEVLRSLLDKYAVKISL